MPFASRTSMKHPPPTPLLCPSTTPSVSAVAIAASIAFPPDFIAATPASVASGCTLATMPCGAVATLASPIGQKKRTTNRHE